MKKTALLILAGILTGIGGIFIFYLFLTSLMRETNFIFLVISIILITIGSFCLYKATNPKKEDTFITDQNVVYEKTVQSIQQHNQVIASWEKTNEDHDKLELLKMAGRAAEEAKKES